MRKLIVGEGDSVGVGKKVLVSSQDQDSFDEAPQSTEAAREDGDNNLDDPDVGVAEVEAMNPEPAKEDSE